MLDGDATVPPMVATRAKGISAGASAGDARGGSFEGPPRLLLAAPVDRRHEGRRLRRWPRDQVFRAAEGS